MNLKDNNAVVETIHYFKEPSSMLRKFSSLHHSKALKATSFLNVQGAIVMLYHPCTPKDLVDQLRKIVVGCLRNQSSSIDIFGQTHFLKV